MPEDSLAVELRREAERDSPQFSQPLHERIMRSISQASVQSTPKTVTDLRWRLLVAIAAAAALALAFLLHDWNGQPVASPVVIQTPAGVRTLPAIPELGNVVTRISDPATERLEAARYAYLDQDAQRLTRYMIHQIDVLPSRP